MRFILALTLVLINVSVSSAEAKQSDTDVKLTLTSGQLSEVDQAKSSCYQTALAAESIASSISERVIPKLKIAFLDEDAVYKVIQTPGGTVCNVLMNPGANDMGWGFGQQKLLGCSCKVNATVK